MNTAEIVIGEVQRDSGFQVRQLLLNAFVSRVRRRIAILIVLSFHERCADVVGIGIALSDLGYNPRDACWGV